LANLFCRVLVLSIIRSWLRRGMRVLELHRLLSHKLGCCDRCLEECWKWMSGFSANFSKPYLRRQYCVVFIHACTYFLNQLYILLHCNSKVLQTGILHQSCGLVDESCINFQYTCSHRSSFKAQDSVCILSLPP
jgi:hypothetical protein